MSRWRLLVPQRGPGQGVFLARGAGHPHLLSGVSLLTFSTSQTPNSSVTSSVKLCPGSPGRVGFGAPMVRLSL